MITNRVCCVFDHRLFRIFVSCVLIRFFRHEKPFSKSSGQPINIRISPVSYKSEVSSRLWDSSDRGLHLSGNLAGSAVRTSIQNFTLFETWKTFLSWVVFLTFLPKSLMYSLSFVSKMYPRAFSCSTLDIISSWDFSIVSEQNMLLVRKPHSTGIEEWGWMDFYFSTQLQFYEYTSRWN